VYYDIVLRHSGDKYISTIKQIRLCTGLGLREAIDMATQPPQIVKAGIQRREAEDIRQAFAQIGARAEIVPSRSKRSGRQRRQKILNPLHRKH
jgi:large subunit ribosomal protein L7/L12